MIMESMTMNEFAEVVKFAQTYHKFGHYVSEREHAEDLKLYPNMSRYRSSIKYIDSCYDSRDARIWSITFRQGIDGIRFSCNHFAMTPKPAQWKYESLYDLCMAYLTGEFINTNGFTINRD